MPSPFGEGQTVPPIKHRHLGGGSPSSSLARLDL